MRQSIVALGQLADDRSLFGLVVARGVSSVGDWLYLAALPILVYRATGNVALVGLIAAGRLLPWLLLSVPAGIVVDRYGPQRVVVITEWVRAGLMLLMGALTAIDAPLAITLLAATAAAAASTFAMPAFGRLVPEIAQDGDQLGRANVVGSGLDSVACIIGPGVAALLILSGGLELAFLLNGLSFLCVVAVLRTIPLRRIDVAADTTTSADSGPLSVPSWSRLARAILRPLAIDAAVSFSAGLLMVLPVLVIASAGAGEGLAGGLSLAAGIGGVVGAGAAGSFVNTRPGRGMTVGLVAAVAGLVVLGSGAQAAGVALGILSLAAAVVVLDTLNLTQIQRTVDDRLLGRGFGVINTSAAVWVILGSLVPTLLVEVLGLQMVVLGSGLLVGILGVLGLFRMPTLPWAPSLRSGSEAEA
jgi:MFS family permease